MSLVEKRRASVIRNLQILKDMGVLSEKDERVALKKYNIKDQKTLARERAALKRYMKTHSLSKSVRPTRRRRCRRLFTQHDSGSSESDWASSGDEWQPSPSPSTQSRLSIKNKNKNLSQTAIPQRSAKSSNKPNISSAFIKTSNTGALMEAGTSGRHYPKRKVPQPDYKEPSGDPEDDRYLYCYECECMVINHCKSHPIMWIKNLAVDDCDAASSGDRKLCTCSFDKTVHAKKTAPEEYVFVGRSSIRLAGLGVWAEKEIPLGTIFGPYGGEVVYLDTLSTEDLETRSRRGYAWLVRENLLGTKGHLVDASNPVASNWLRFVNCARNEEEQTLVTIQYRGKIYYRACKTIPPNVELLTYYGEKFAKELGIAAVEEPASTSSEAVTKASLHHKSDEKCADISISRSSEKLLQFQRCPICRERFSSCSSLRRHISTVHDYRREYTCEFCGKDFGQEGTLKSHIKLVHENRREYTCEFCGKDFGRKGHLKRHIKSVHENRREYTCEFCGKDFGRKGTLKGHIKSVHENRREYTCEFCGKDFGRKGHLKRHIKSVHEKANED